MKWSIHQLSKYRQSGLSIDEPVDLPGVLARDREIRALSPVRVQGHCTFGASKMMCHFELSGTLTLPCARTWEDVELPFQTASDEVFSWERDSSLLESDDYHPVEGDIVDPTAVFEELVLLEVPLQVVKEGAEEFRHSGGPGWSYAIDEEVEARGGEEPKVDPRLADLAKLFDQTDKE